MKTFIILMVIISLFPAVFLSACGGGGGTADEVSSSVSLPGVSSLVKEDGTINNGTVTGIVDKRLLAYLQCTGSKTVYIFQGHDASPDDIDKHDPNPVKSATVTYDSVSRQYGYSVTSLAEGNYTLTLTCQADRDSPLEDDDIRFGGTKNVTVTGGREIIGHLFM